MIKRRMIILSFVIALLLVASIIAVYIMRVQKTNGTVCAKIYRDNELIKTVDLSANEKPYSFTIEFGDGDYNTIEVRDGSIGITEASCPDKVCKNMGFIHNSYMPITCLPNHLIIRIENEENSYDGFAY